MSRREAVIVEAVRTPVGRYGGVLREVRPDDLASLVITAVVESTGINDGAAALVVMERKASEAANLKPLARWVTCAVAGVEPERMGLHPRAGIRPAKNQPKRRRHRPGPSPGLHRRPPADHPAARDAQARPALRNGHHVRRSGAGDRHPGGASLDRCSEFRYT